MTVTFARPPRGRPVPVGEAPARSGACPTPECGAPPGARCNAGTGGTRTYSHPDRHPRGGPVDGYVRDATGEEVRATYWPGGVPAGYRVGWFDALTAGEDIDWALADDAAQLCRFIVGPRQRTCRRPAVVTMRRGKAGRWGYCDLAEHLYGRRYEPGPPPRLLTARLYPMGGEGQ